MNPPTNLRTRAMDALCDDLFDIGAGKATSFQRLDALRQIQQTTQGTSGVGNHLAANNRPERN